MYKYVDLTNGSKMAYVEAGQGPDVVFVHGLSSSADISWEPIFPLMDKDIHCIAYDQPGHGKTVVGKDIVPDEWLLGDHLNGFLEAMDLHDVILAGHSLGGIAVYDYIMKYGCGDRIKAVAIIDQSPFCGSSEYPFALRAGIKYDEVKDQIKTDFRTFMKDFYTAVDPNGVGKMTDAQKDAYVTPILEMLSPDIFLELMRVSQKIDFRPCLKEIKVPFGYFYANPGSIYQPALTDYYKDNVGGQFTAYQFSTTTHAIPRVHPDEFCRRFVSFVKSLG